MRYGKSSGNVEIDFAQRRKPSQSLKKAAPGAPFGWTSEGTPYIGTQYAIVYSPSGMKFASVSTRNGSGQYYWKSLSSLSAKVALSALETYGKIGNLLAGESLSRTIGDVLSAEQLDQVRAVFVRLLGADVISRFEIEGDDGSSSSEPDGLPDDAEDANEGEPSAVGAKREAKPEAATHTREEGASKKRQARMALVDDLKVMTSAKKQQHQAVD